MKTLKGYTLIEVLLAIALFSMLIFISVPVFSNFLYLNELDSAVDLTVRALRTAQTFSQGVNQDSNWGVAVVGNSVVVFKGTSYSTRDTAADYVYTTGSNVVFSGVSEVVYTKFYGIPQSTGSINLSSYANVRQISINAKGNITY